MTKNSRTHGQKRMKKGLMRNRHDRSELGVLLEWRSFSRPFISVGAPLPDNGFGLLPRDYAVAHAFQENRTNPISRKRRKRIAARVSRPIPNVAGPEVSSNAPALVVTRQPSK